MAHSGVQTKLSQQHQYHCKDCGLNFDSVKSLDVHLHYHKENLLSKWANQSHINEESNNNNNSNNQKNGITNGKGRGGNFGGIVMAPADSSDGIMKNRRTPTPSQPRPPSTSSSNMFTRNSPPISGSFTRPPTPYNGIPSPYQSDNQRFSPATSQRPSSNFSYHSADSIQTSSQYSNFTVSSTYITANDQIRTPNDNSGMYCDSNFSNQNSPSSYILGSGSDFPLNSANNNSSNNSNMRTPTPNSVPSSPSSSVPNAQTPSFRFHPYHNPTNHSSQQSIGFSPNENRNMVSSSRFVQSPSSSTSVQCEKCGFICDSNAVLINHFNLVHQAPANMVSQSQQQPFIQNHMYSRSEQDFKQEFREELIRSQQRQNLQNSNSNAFIDFHAQNNSDNPLLSIQIKEEPPAEILDLDSHKVHVYQPPEEEEDLGLPETENEPARESSQHPHSVSAMLWGNNQPPPNAEHPKSFQQRVSPQFGGVTSSLTSPPSNPPNNVMVPQASPYQQHRPYLPHQDISNMDAVSSNAHSHISSSQFSNMNPTTQNSLPKTNSASTQSQQKSNQSGNQSWKSNEARRPKTYNCSACNKWFTSSGHLKRHYNTTLHKNAVKQSGAPDPASLPINQHHHPNRETNNVSHRMTPNPGGGENSSPSPNISGEETTRSEDTNNFDRITPQQLHVSAMQQSNNSMIVNPPNRMAGPSAEVAPGGLHFLSPFTSEDPNSVRTSPVALPSPHMTPHMLGETSPSPHLTTPLGSHLIHHPIPQQVTMQRHPMSPPSTIFPNGLPPHVSTTQPLISTNQHLLTTTTGNSTSSPTQTSVVNMDDMAQNHLFFSGLFPSPVQSNHHPLPSFAAQFHQNHMFGSNNNHLSVLSGFNGMSQYSTSGYPLVSTFENVGGLCISPENELILENTFSSSSPIETNLTYNIKLEDEVNMNYMSAVDDFSPPHHNNNNIPVSSDSNGSIGDDLCNLSPVGTSDDPTSTNDDFEQIEKKFECKQEENTKVTSSTNIKSVYDNNKIFTSHSISNGAIHKCIECDKVFNKACYLTQHNKSFHSGHKPYKCTRCGKRFPADILYQEHLSKHAGDKPYKCKDCPKQFNHKTDLRRHMCLHTGEKPYACDICGKGFIRKDHMLKHCETHRKKTSLPNKVMLVLPA